MTVQRRQTEPDQTITNLSAPKPVSTTEVPDLNSDVYYISNETKKTKRHGGENISIVNRGVKAIINKKDINILTPKSLFANLNTRSEHYDQATQSYVFNRSSVVFESVLDFYNTGTLHLPRNMCFKACIQELEYWQLSVDFLCPACRNRYYQDSAQEKMEAELEKLLRPPTVSQVEFERSCRYQIWCFVERPSSSYPAKLYALIIFASIVCSIVLLCLETLPFLRFIPIKYQDRVNNTPEENLLQYMKFSQKHFALDVAEMVCASLALLDMMLRFCVSYDKAAYFRNPINLVDILYILPSVAGIVISRLQIVAELTDVWSMILRVAMVMARTLRVLRLFWIARHFKPLKVMLLAIQSSMSDLLLMFVATFLLLGIFAILIYNTEAAASTFPDMIVAMWWAVVTMTTLGYGDYVPKTILGRLIAALCALTGIMIISMMIPVVSNHFNVLHQTSKHILEKLAVESKLKKTLTKVREQGEKAKGKTKEMAKMVLVKHNQIVPETVKDWYM